MTHRTRRYAFSALVLLLIAGTACATTSRTDIPATDVQATTGVVAGVTGSDSHEQGVSELVTLSNQGGNMEGHTPIGFRGMGTGLFAGDNLNPSFPNGDGVQTFLTFDLSTLGQTEVVTATLRSRHARVVGTPFEDLGNLVAEEIRYDRFSPDLWQLKSPPITTSCVLASRAQGPYECDVTDAVKRSLGDGYGFAQFRVRFEMPGDSDGAQDMVMFFITGSNTNEAGIFELVVTVKNK